MHRSSNPSQRNNDGSHARQHQSGNEARDQLLIHSDQIEQLNDLADLNGLLGNNRFMRGELAAQLNSLQYIILQFKKQIKNNENILEAILNRFKALIEAATDEQLQRISNLPKYIATVLHGLGVMLSSSIYRGGLLSNFLTDMFFLLMQLARRQDANSQEIANSLYGIGKLAKAHWLSETLDSQLIQDLLGQLAKKQNVSPQDISNSLYGVGKLAEAQPLSNAIDGRLIQNLLEILVDKHSEGSQQHIANSLYGVGKLAEAQRLSGAIDSNPIRVLLTQLTSEQDGSTQHIANSLYGVGKLVKTQCLSGKINCSVIQDLLGQLASRQTADSQEIANSFYGIGELAEAEYLLGTIDSNSIRVALTQLAGWQFTKSQEIANSLYGIGKIAKASCLSGELDIRLIHYLLEQLLASRRNAHSQEIANSLFGVGKLAEIHCLLGILDSHLIQCLLEQLASWQMASSQHIANSLYGVGKLAEAYYLSDVIDSNLIQALLKQLAIRQDASSQHIANSLYGIGKLAETYYLSEILDGHIIQALLRQLTSRQDASSQHMANSLYALGLLHVTGMATEIQNIRQFVEKVLAHHFEDAKHISQLAMGMSYYNLELPPPLIQQLLKEMPMTNAMQRQLSENLKRSELPLVVNCEALIGGWFVDLLVEYRNIKLVIELDGSQHYDEYGKLKSENAWRDYWLEQKGYQVFRYRNEEFVLEKVQFEIEEHLKSARMEQGGPSGLQSQATLFSARPVSSERKEDEVAFANEPRFN